MPRIAHGAVPSPNIWNHPQVYEVENRAVDPDGVIEAVLQTARVWSGATILDVGCGTGYPPSALRSIGDAGHRRRAASRPRSMGPPALPTAADGLC